MTTLSTKHYTENKRFSNTNPTKNGGAPEELAVRASLETNKWGCSGRVGSPCFTRDTRRVTLVTNPLRNHTFSVLMPIPKIMIKVNVTAGIQLC